MEVKPFKDDPSSRKEQVRKMFDHIATRYDFLNHLLSFNVDKRWRAKLKSMIKEDCKTMISSGKRAGLLDVATGTGDLAFALSSIDNLKITGLDLSPEMITVAKSKAIKRGKEIDFHVGDSESLLYEDEDFDFLTVAFGVRNFENLDKGLSEFFRVLKPGGKIYILEFSVPPGRLFRSLYYFYSRRILPSLATLFGGERRAYSYLPESIAVFPHGEEMNDRLKKTGFTDAGFLGLSRGIATIYRAQKPEI